MKTKEELIDIIIAIDREDIDANKPEKGGGSFFSEELRSRIGDAILPTLTSKHKEHMDENKIAEKSDIYVTQQEKLNKLKKLVDDYDDSKYITVDDLLIDVMNILNK